MEEEKTIKMQRLRELMEKTFDLLKAKGLFQNYKNYQEWLKEKYPKND